MTFYFNSDYSRVPAEARPYHVTVQMLQYAQWFEDIEFHRELLDFEMRDVEIFTRNYKDEKITHSQQRQEFECYLKIPKGSAKKLKSLMEDISLVISYTLKTRRDGVVSEKDITVPGNIKSVREGILTFTTHFNFRAEVFTSPSVFFEFNRSSTRASLKALEDVTKNQTLMDFLTSFDASQVNSRMFDGKKFCEEEFEWSNPQLRDNEEQQIAIINVVNRTAYPLPYVIFGPPGEIFWEFFFKEFYHLLILSSQELEKLRPWLNASFKYQNFDQKLAS
jgi:hypothetical protein